VLLGAKRIARKMTRRHPGGPSCFRPVFKGFCEPCRPQPGRKLGRAPPPDAPFRSQISLFRPEISVPLGQPPSASKATQVFDETVPAAKAVFRVKSGSK